MLIDLIKTQKYLEWMKTKLYLDSISKSTISKKVFRGEVYWCHFGINIGSEMSKETVRPGVILQNNIANLNSPNVIVAPITHDSGNLPCLVPINTIYNVDGSVKLEGNVNTSNIMCISKSRLVDSKITTLTNLEMNDIDISVAKQISLMEYYSKIKKQLNSKDDYIKKLKLERNNAQDLLKEIRIKLGIENDHEIIKRLSQILDNDL